MPKQTDTIRAGVVRLTKRDIRFLLFCMGSAAGVAQSRGEKEKRKLAYIDRASVRIIKKLP